MSPLHRDTRDAPWPLVLALVEDDRLLREEIEVHLRANGFDVYSANSASGLDDLSARIAFDLYLIDLNLPGENGLSLCRRVRQSRPDAGIVIMTARVALNDRIAGYKQGGADIYLTKPVSPDELVLVLLSLGRRLKQTQAENEWSLSLRDRTLLGPEPEQKLRLTSKEKTILLALVQAKDNTLESGVLCDLFAEEDDDAPMSKHALEELIARLRKKFKSVQAEGDEPAIKSVWGVGYQLCVKIKFIH
ncbi:response regulator transcription factor [Limnohabitans sp.]|uniref:response regulator transcription factor n=1 Tax=Limnohabitans sp. TaxID=1907725 RepID=UPI002AFF7EB5|nr:response regulator transcription factor [Limnohabitans sp.]